MVSLNPGQLALVNAHSKESPLDLALAHARDGWHVFPLRPGTKVPLIGKKQGGNGAHDGTTDPEVIRSWWRKWPTAGIGANLGDDRIAFDLDFQHGATRWSQLPDTRTHLSGRGNGNAHLIYRFEPGSLASRIKSGTHVLGDGVDIRTGRGSYIVMPGTPHEETGEPYTVEDPEVEFHILTDEEVVLVWEEAGATLPGEPKDRQATQTATVAAVSSGGLPELLAAPPTEGGRNDWLTRVAGHLVAKHRGNPEVYRAKVREAAATTNPPMSVDEVDKTLESIEERDGENHPGEGPNEGSKVPDAVKVNRFVEANYEFVVTSSLESYAIPRNGANRLPIPATSETLAAQVKSRMFRESGKNWVPGKLAVEQGISLAATEGMEDPTVRDVYLRSTEIPGGVVLDLGQPGNTKCVLVTAEGWNVLEAPPEGVLFRRTNATFGLPDPVKGGSLEPLRVLLGWPCDDRRWMVVRGWLAAAPFASISRPFLAFLGNQGSAKTSRAKVVVDVLDPREELGGSFGKNLKDDQVMALGRYLVGWDNLTSVSDAASSHFCRVVTGDSADARTLYSDTGLTTIAYRRTGVLTAINMPPFKPDALERLVPLACDRLTKTERRGEKDLKADFRTNHPQILGAVLDDVVTVLQNLDASRARVAERERNADFHDVLYALDPKIADEFTGLTLETMRDAAESDPFVMSVVQWLEGRPKDAEDKLVPKDAYEQASVTRDSDDYSFWPGDPSKFSGHLTRCAEPLAAMGWRVERVKQNGVRYLRFHPTEQLDFQ